MNPIRKAHPSGISCFYYSLNSFSRLIRIETFIANGYLLNANNKFDKLFFNSFHY